MSDSVVSVYEQSLQRRGFVPDPSQWRAVERLQKAHEEWTEYKKKRSSALRRLLVKPRNDLEGVLQDVHWAVGSFGYFPSYALGAVMAAQLYEALREAVPDVDQQIARGEFGGLMGWLRENVHSQGARVSAQELLKNATGKPLSAASALRYLEGKYLEDETVVGSAAA